MLRDLSVVQRLNAEVNALKSRMREIFDLASVAIWISEGEQIVFANRACEALFGADNRDSLVGRSIDTLLGPESRESLRQKMKAALETNKPVAMSTERIAWLDGATLLVEIVLAPLTSHGQTTLRMVITDVTEKMRVTEDLERSRQRLRRLTANLVATREDERLRIARELHDDLGQRLAVLQMGLSTLDPIQSEASRAQVAAMLAMVSDTVASVRRITTELRPLMLDDLGLSAAVEWLVNDWQRRTGISVTLCLDAVDELVVDTSAIAIYRIVQEALTNVVRHAHASRVGIELRRQADELVLVVQDNGTGFPAPAMHQAASHGLLGIDERATVLGGRLDIDAAPGGGARLSVTLPLKPATVHEGSARTAGRSP